MNPKTKTIIAISLFSFFGLFSFIANAGPTTVTLLATFYLLLVINTFYSIRLFFPLEQNKLSQKIFDGVLFVFYFLLAFSFNNPHYFTLILSIFFGLAVFKYIFLYPSLTNEHHLLRHKIVAEILGCILGLIAFYGVNLGYTLESVWFLLIVFVIANIFLFFVSPLYVLDEDVK